MIRMITASTTLIDEPEEAIIEILKQLDIERQLQQNSVGILTCYTEYRQSGIVKDLCNLLPFDVIGINTFNNATSNGHDQFMLSIAVLTSNDIAFATGLSDPINGEPKKSIQSLYQNVSNKLIGKPSLMMTMAPLSLDTNGDKIIRYLDEVSGFLPNFGSLAIDTPNDFQEPWIIYNGQHYANQLAILLFSGDVQPYFSVAIASETKILKQKAIVTKSEGHILKEVNGIPALQYMETLSLSKNGNLSGALSTPIIIDSGDGSPPIARNILQLTEEGHAICGGEIPEKSMLSIGLIDSEDVVKTTALSVQKASAQKENGILIFSCVGRSLALELEINAEIEGVQNCISDKIPFLFAYSSGEICPVFNQKGELLNRFHNNSIVILAF